jgi:hypothetical protein
VPWLPDGIGIFKPKIQIWANYGGFWNEKCRFILSSFGILQCPVLFAIFGILLPGLVCFTKKIWQTWLGAIC